jgi:hypothetical protein
MMFRKKLSFYVKITSFRNITLFRKVSNARQRRSPEAAACHGISPADENKPRNRISPALVAPVRHLLDGQGFRWGRAFLKSICCLEDGFCRPQPDIKLRLE